MLSRILAAAAVVAVAGAVCASDALGASTPPRVYPLLQQGSHGKPVKGLQWLLGGHKPSAYDIRTFDHKPNGKFGSRTAVAVVEMKRRLGWPTEHLKPTAGGDFMRILLGKRKRPIGYLIRATRRLAADKEIEAQKADTACARRIVSVARGELGVHEIPDGSNDSVRIRVYQAVTRAFRAPWCASFVQWTYQVARVGTPKAWSGPIADNSAGVFYIIGWARARGWLRSIPQPGYLVAFRDRLGHIGIVERVFTTGYATVEGNASNRVLARFHPYSSRPVVFIRIPGCA